MTTATARRNGRTKIGDPSNDGAEAIATGAPYIARVTIEGSTAVLYHRWSSDEVDSKAGAPKNSRAKKTDNLEAYVYRLDNGHLGIPGEWLRGSIINAAKFRQDPRSTRKSAMDLFKAGVTALTDVADVGVRDWDYVDRRRATVQRSGITRHRPALKAGWQATIELMVNLPEYIDPATLLEVVGYAGRIIGVGDFRPTFGRFNVVRWDVRSS